MRMCNKLTKVLVVMLFVLAMVRCKQSPMGTTNSLPVTMDDSSRAIINRAIAYAGGYETWEQKRTLSFDKKSFSYDSSGKIIREIDQHFDYMMKPEFKAKISYRLSDTTITLIHDGQKARKLYNGKVSNLQKDIDGAWNSIFGSQFVICMPFKLKDPGIKAEYVGQVVLKGGIPAQVVKTSYMKGAGSNPELIWYYYFEPVTGKLLANSENGKNNYWDYTGYDKFEKTNGLLMPSVRIGYTADSLNKPGKMVSESRSSQIVFDKEFPKDYFNIPDDK